ncbi:MAG: glycosyltransferase family 4 protein [Candidatus Lokiarchaeota archaeon]|nr:glycosyltransferase family 4 protein [Candidatus Lokiarchaeota archaeon]
MIKILLILPRLKNKGIGGAEKSILNISLGLKKTEDFQIEYYFGKPNLIYQKIFKRISLENYVLIPKILLTIKKIKPDIIITQTRISFAATIAAKLCQIPIINIVRDSSDFCPKFVDIIGYGKACPRIENRKICYDCIRKWRSLRVLIGNKPKEWEHSLKASISNLAYMIRYFSCKLNLAILNKATVILVASKLIKSFLTRQIKSEKIKIMNITPIDEKERNNTTKKKKELLFIIPSYESSHKGLDFILRLAKEIPEDYKIVIVGNLIPDKKLSDIQTKITNFGRVPNKVLDELYQSSSITLVPSFLTDAFGRIIIESILNGTPVISSPNCGANYFLKDKKFLRILPIDLKLWIKEIDEIIKNPIFISEHEIDEIYNKFSIEKSIRDLSNLIKNLFK